MACAQSRLVALSWLFGGLVLSPLSAGAAAAPHARAGTGTAFNFPFGSAAGFRVPEVKLEDPFHYGRYCGPTPEVSRRTRPRLSPVIPEIQPRGAFVMRAAGCVDTPRDPRVCAASSR
jgi:hypothetical protein